MPAKRSSATPLRRALNGSAPLVRSNPMDALLLARRWFLKGQRLDLQQLAAALSVNRVTLYRWVGTHEMLLGEVLCSLADLAWEEASRTTRRTGSDYAANVLYRFLTLIHDFVPIQRFVKSDGEFALKVLTSKHSRLQECVIQHVRALLQEQVGIGQLDLPRDLDSLAYALVRICEAFLYNDLITGRKPDLGKAAEIINALLHSPWKTLKRPRAAIKRA